jgi:hypothetical protein
VPAGSLSRVSSYDYLVSTGSIPLGNLLAGLVAASAGLQTTLVGMTVVGVGGALAVCAVPSVRSLGRGAATAQVSER